jgi:hypothetical protein
MIELDQAGNQVPIRRAVAWLAFWDPKGDFTL